MAKTKAGLPAAFDLNIPSQPAVLGDYLDEDPPTTSALALRKSREIQPAPKVEPAVEERISVEPTPRPIERSQRQVEQTVPFRKKPEKVTQERRARMQMNMGANTVAAYDQLVAFVQKYTLQDDASASEVFEALVGALNDAKQYLEFSDVGRRGPWGSPTAKAFVTGLERSFAKAIATNYLEGQKLSRAGNG